MQKKLLDLIKKIDNRIILVTIGLAFGVFLIINKVFVANYDEMQSKMYREEERSQIVQEIMALKNQENGITTVVEIMTTRELGDPFRRDAMKLPQRRLEKYKCTDRFEESATGQPVDLHSNQ